VAAQKAALADRTPYDTGKRSEPKVWTKSHIEDDDDYGKVDFENDEGGTLATLYIEKDEDGTYALRGDANEPLKVEIETDEDPLDPVLIQPSEALKTKVRDTIEELYSPYEREEATVYWQEGQALILVPGEKHVRKQQIIMVHEPGYPYADIDSAIVKGWESGVQRTRID
jgi:hypothetical protein